jgi:hypothetical protein
LHPANIQIELGTSVVFLIDAAVAVSVSSSWPLRLKRDRKLTGACNIFSSARLDGPEETEVNVI